MLRVQARPSSGDSDNDIDAAGIIRKTTLISSLPSVYSDVVAENYSMLCFAAREDLAKLQRQFRLTEGSRKQYADQATNTLRKQQYV